MAKVPKFKNLHNQQAYEALEKTTHPNVFAQLGGTVTQGETRQKYWAEQDLRKIIYSAIAIKKTSGKTTAKLAHKVLGKD